MIKNKNTSSRALGTSEIKFQLFMKKNYFLPKSYKGFKKVEETYIPLYDWLKQNKAMKLLIDINPDIIEERHTLMLNEIILLAEYNKEWIDQLLFSVEFKFRKIKDSELYYQHGEWQSDKEIQRWLRRNGESLPFTCFFLTDWEARFYSIIGDFIADGEASIRKIDELHVNFSIEKDGKNLIDNRVGLACQLFMYFCHETDFDPKQAIEAILAEFRTWYGYDKVKEQFEMDMKKGVKYRAGLKEEFEK